MSFEKEPRYIIRSVIDTVQQCNLRCGYCHPGRTWEENVLPAEKIEDFFEVAENRGLLEITLTGGEITLHPELTRILQATHVLDRTVATLITNGTLLTHQLASELRDSNIARMCISLDGSNAETHNFGRGKTFDQALKGLHLLQETEKPITVISVAHHGNYRQIIELSELLAVNHFASQHHICAPSYSGSARNNYEKYRLRECEFFELQAIVDNSFNDLNRDGLYVTFNSFWPATGERSKADRSRTITLVQLTEQLKDCYIIVRSNGDVRVTSAAWGRETVGNAVVGNLNFEPAKVSFEKAENIYAFKEVKQLPRAIEAVHKFCYGVNANSALTDKILDDKKDGQSLVSMVPVKPLSQFDLFKIGLLSHEKDLIDLARIDSGRFRIVNVADDSYVLFDRVTCHTTLLKPDEIGVISSMVA